MSEENERKTGKTWLVIAIICLVVYVFANLANEVRKMKARGANFSQANRN